MKLNCAGMYSLTCKKCGVTLYSTEKILEHNCDNKKPNEHGDISITNSVDMPLDKPVKITKDEYGRYFWEKVDKVMEISEFDKLTEIISSPIYLTDKFLTRAQLLARHLLEKDLIKVENLK